MRSTTIILSLTAVSLSAAGQLLLKSGVRHLEKLGRLEFLMSAARQVQVLSGLIAWAAATICWLYVLRDAPLSRAYGLTSLTYVLTFLASVLLLGEHVRRVHIAGTVLVVIGVACLLSGE